MADPKPPKVLAPDVPLVVAKVNSPLVIDSEPVEVPRETAEFPPPAPPEPDLLPDTEPVAVWEHPFPAPPTPPNGHLDAYTGAVVEWATGVFAEIYDALTK